MPIQILFPDHCVTYDTLVRDIADRIAQRLTDIRQQPLRISQRQAWITYGRANVTRWVRTGQLTPHKRPGRIEYLTADLLRLQLAQQDYLITGRQKD